MVAFSPYALGLDYMDEQSVATLKAVKAKGAGAAGAYVSPEDMNKTVTKEQVQRRHSVGLGTWLQYETAGNHFSYFTRDQAKKDAEIAHQVFDDIGAPQGFPLHACVDCEINADQAKQIIDSYFHPLQELASGRWDTRGYGEWLLIELLHQAGFNDGWQAAAWSHHKRSTHAAIYQVRNGVNWCGFSNDLNYITSADAVWMPDGQQLALTEEIAMLDIITPDADKSTNAVARHFALHEFACKGCGDVRINAGFIDLVSRLDALREDAGHPVVVTAGYRCPEHNAKVPNAAKDSEHIQGIAADIKCPAISYDELYKLAEKYFGDGGIGRYSDGHVHVDVGPKRRWTN